MKYKIIVDKQSRTNPSDERREYEIDIEELRVKGDIYDSLVITKDEDYVMRRLALSEYQVLSVLEEPIKQTLADINIELFEGDNYIYLIDMVGNKLYAEYLIKNDFNDVYITKSEAHSSINQTAYEIELSVNQKLEDYATTEEVNSKIEQKADSIISTVSSTYSTKNELNAAKSEIKQTTDSITSTVSKKVGNDEIISKINQSAEEIAISADRINIEGKKVKFKTDTETQYTYSQSDIDKIKQHIMGTTTLTQAQIDLYDINNDGRISASDYAMLKSEITDNGGTFIHKGSFEINPDSAKENIIIRDENGSVITSVGLYGMKTRFLGIQQAYIDNMIADAVSYKTLTQTSQKSKKKNIRELKISALELIRNANICEYNFKGEKKNAKKHIGLVIGEGYNCPDEIISENRQGVEQYSMTSLAWKAIQELIEKNKELQQRLERLEEKEDG